MQGIKSRINYNIVVVIFLIVAFGIVNIYSASVADNTHRFFYHQILWVIAGITAGYPFFKIDYRVIGKYSIWLYLLSILLLAGVLFLGPRIKGAHRWYVLGPFSFQPSEFAKFAMIFYLSFILSEEKVETLDLPHLLIPSIVIFLPAGLVLLQPDLGTSGLIILIGAGVLLIYGISKRILWTSVASGIAGAVILWKFILKGYQRRRILAFLNPESDPLGSGYHIIQSKIAIGSGGWFGKGFLKGTQTQLSFLPEQHTDFAFSVFAEEWGFVGVFFIFILYLLLILWGIDVATNAKDKLGRILAYGIVVHLFIQVIINLSMITGAFPVVGIPLPLFSYGGSSTLFFFTELALLFNIDARRFMF